jgi:hypothetical protein
LISSPDDSGAVSISLIVDIIKEKKGKREEEKERR